MSASLRAGISSDGYLQIDGADIVDITASGMAPSSGKTITANQLSSAMIPMFQDFRLTLTSGVPVTTSDVTGATMIYCTPYRGNRIALYDGTRWNLRTSAEFSLALGTLTSGKPYDVFCYDNAGTPTLEFLVWTNDTTRATALAYQDGVLVKSGAATRRYLGTFYTTASTTTEDSATKRYLWNYYNRSVRPMLRRESTASWTYSTASFRQANNSASNQLDFVIGVSEDLVSAVVATAVECTTTTGVPNVSIGLDSTAAAASASIGGTTQFPAGGRGMPISATFKGFAGVGRHYLAWLEKGVGSDTQTWYGTSGNYGIIGEVPA